MTVAVASIWELGWDTPLREQDLWRFVAAEFELDSVWMTPVSGIYLRDSSIMTERASMTDILDELGIIGVFLTQDADVTLEDFAHPESCVYVTGANEADASQHMRKGDLSVRIRTPKGGGGLWGHQAAAIALYDRQVKAWPQP